MDLPHYAAGRCTNHLLRALRCKGSLEQSQPLFVPKKETQALDPKPISLRERCRVCPRHSSARHTAAVPAKPWRSRPTRRLNFLDQQAGEQRGESMDWPLQEQQDRLNQVVEEALRSGPQVITVNNKEIAVVVPIQEYRRMHHPADTWRIS
jgi:prevent-host-death family protein